MTLNRRFFVGMIAVMTVWGMSTAQSAEDISVPKDYQTIQLAVDNAVDGDTIIVEPGTYNESITLKSGVTLKGRETARTFLRARDKDLSIITVDRVENINIRNFTFIGFAIEMTAIKVTQSNDVEITNNVFDIGSYAVGVDIPGDQNNIDIINNTFYAAKIAIDRAFSTVKVENNIFVKNDEAISGTSSDNISSNCFFANKNTNFGSRATTGEDPLFVDAEISDYKLRDFHLKKDSPCENRGAWAGTYADSVILPVNSVQLKTVVDSLGVGVTWKANQSAKVTGYKVYYDSDRSGAPYDGNDAAGGTSPIDVGDVTKISLDSLSPGATQPAVPVLIKVAGSYQRLTVSWSAVEGATGYKIYYGLTDVTANEESVGNVTSYTLTGLENGTVYKVAVSALAKTTYYVAVKAYGNTSNESAYSDEASIVIGEGLESELSSENTGIPEKVAAYPDLPDEGCFIATAAYGSYGTTEVKILRNFRDQYLLTNNIGRDFVRLYYAYSPSLAGFVSESALLKHTVKLMLTPVVAGSLFLLSANDWLEQFMANWQVEELE